MKFRARLMLVALVVMAGCATTPETRLDAARLTLATAGKTVAAAAVEVRRVDAARLEEISRTCPDRPACEAALVAHQADFIKAKTLLDAAEAVVREAADVVVLVEAGVKTWEDVAALLPGLVDLGLRVKAMVDAFKSPGK